MLAKSFDPVITRRASVLVLGSMPGQLSLAVNEYYAHPRNRFWQVMLELCGARSDQSYAGRIDMLNRAGIALWDVLQHCEREGSLDARIEPSSEVPNDFPSLLGRYPGIRSIAFNGQKAAHAFETLVAPSLSGDQRERLVFHALPSTSPANASTNRSELLEKWRVIQAYLNTVANAESRP